MKILSRYLPVLIALMILLTTVFTAASTYAASQTFESVSIWPPPITSWHPDLVIELSDSCSFCYKSVDVVNRGVVSAEAFNVTLTIRDSGVVNVSTVKVPGLSVGGRQTVYTLPASGIAPDCVTVRADSTNVVRERNESNNTWQYNPFWLCPAP